MKSLIPILLIVLTSLLPACSGGGGGGDTGNTGTTQTAVILSISESGTPGQAAAASPGGLTAEELGINHIVLTISGPDMDTITKRLDVRPGSTSLRSDFFVPNGKDRLFSAEAFSTAEVVLYRGATRIPELTGRPTTLSDESFTQLPDGTFRKTVFIQLEGNIIENVCIDEDNDGYGAGGDLSCPNGSEPDCNDSDSTIHPGADDSDCNGIDENCDGEIDEDFVATETETTCGVGTCIAHAVASCIAGEIEETCNPPEPTTEYTVSEVGFTGETLTENAENRLYGDDDSVSYTLPWDFPFYGQNHRTIQITTNGSIWLTKDDGDYGNGSQWGGLYDIFLPTGNDPEEDTNFIPIIVPWNEDLTSEYYGNGVTVEVKTNPDRLVIQWDTETISTEYYDWPNQFEAVLFPDGTIRFDYIYIDPDVASRYCNDSGSGVSFGDGYNYTNLTDTFGDACTLGGRSFLFTPPCSFGVHVDQNGSDTAGCGSLQQPCYSISFGLTQTSGHEPVFVAQGDYGSLTTGEIFPLVLKEGTSLLCEGANHSTVIDLSSTGVDETGIDATALDTHIAGCRILMNEDDITGIDGDQNTVIDDCELDGGSSSSVYSGVELHWSAMIRNSSFTNIPGSAIEAFDAGTFILGNTINGNTTGISLLATSPGSVMGNTIRNNRVGIEIVNAVFSPAIRNNILSCNTGTDLLNQAPVTVYTYHNQWDNNPPTELNGKFYSFANYPGVDINNATTGSVITSAPAIAPTPCTFTPDLYVDQNGSDTAGCGTGPGASACLSIGFALQQQPGAIIHVAQGTVPYAPSTTGEAFTYILPQSTTIVCEPGTTIDVEFSAGQAFDTTAPITTVVGCNIINEGGS